MTSQASGGAVQNCLSDDEFGPHDIPLGVEIPTIEEVWNNIRDNTSIKYYRDF